MGGYGGEQQAALRLGTAGTETKEHHCDVTSHIMKLSFCPPNEALDSKQNGTWT